MEYRPWESGARAATQGTHRRPMRLQLRCKFGAFDASMPGIDPEDEELLKSWSVVGVTASCGTAVSVQRTPVPRRISNLK